MTKLFPVEWIEWMDAEHDGGWSQIEDEKTHKLGPCESIGWVVHEDEHRVIMATSLSFDADDSTLRQIGNKQYIPKGMITKRKVLAPVKADAKRRQSKKPRAGNDSGTPVSA